MPKKPVAHASGWHIYTAPMIPDISLGIVFSFLFFGLGIVAFVYLAKGKN